MSFLSGLRLYPVLILVLLTASCSVALAQTSYIYTYSGNDFTTNAFAYVQGIAGVPQAPFTTGDYLTVSLILPAPLLNNQEQVLSNGFVGDYQVSDGVDFVDLDADLSAGYEPQSDLIDLTTDGSGKIIRWDFDVIGAINLQDPSPGGINFYTINDGTTAEDIGYHGQGSDQVSGMNLSTPGSWTESISVPEPSTVAMLAAGLILVSLRRRQVRWEGL